MENKNQIISTVSFIVIFILIVWLFVYFNNKNSQPIINDNIGASTATTTENSLDIFAKCTALKGLTMYGAAWCSHCTAQKKLFGDSFKYVNYVECPDNIKLCDDRGILGYPTWIDNAGKKYEGEQSFDTISKITGCVLSK